MENQIPYQIRKAQPREHLPDADLLEPILHKDRQLNVRVFGPGSYTGNRDQMTKTKYFHSLQFPSISFRPATTPESVSTAFHRFAEYVKPIIFDPAWLQAGYVVRGTEGVWLNPPKDSEGNFIKDERKLKQLSSDKYKKVNGIWLYQGNDPSLRDFVFVPYKSFERGVQDCGGFIEGGLARGLEHTTAKKAEKFEAIASPKLYKSGVSVFGFEPVRESVLKMVGLGFNVDIGDGRLGVGGDKWDDINSGFAFGVSD